MNEWFNILLFTCFTWFDFVLDRVSSKHMEITIKNRHSDILISIKFMWILIKNCINDQLIIFVVLYANKSMIKTLSAKVKSEMFSFFISWAHEYITSKQFAFWILVRRSKISEIQLNWFNNSIWCNMFKATAVSAIGFYKFESN